MRRDGYLTYCSWRLGDLGVRAVRFSTAPNKKAGPEPGFLMLQDRSGGLDIARLLLALVARGDLEGDLLAFLERLESRHVDGGEMGEEIFAATVRSNESETLGVVKPFNSTGCHLYVPSRS